MGAGIYRPLDSALKEIRLLKLLPAASFPEDIQGQLTHTYLTDPCPYEALSYRWGGNNFTQEIKIDGQLIHITKNLEAALRHLRHESTERLIWVDALCINQEDMAERGHQVSMMREIYTRCHTDLAWLGPNPGSVDEQAAGNTNAGPPVDWLIQGLELMRKIAVKDDYTLADLRREQERPNLEHEKFPLFVNPRLNVNVNVLKRGNNVIIRYDKQRILDAAFDQSLLWSRIWVMQELACAPRVVLVAGKTTLEWDLVSKFLGDTPYSDAFHLPWSHGTLNNIKNHTFQKTQLIEHQRGIVRDMAEGKLTSTLMDVLSRFKFAESTDPRDHIYGLLGLVSEEHTIKPDYTKTVAQVFADVCKFFIDSSGTLDIICQNPWQVSGDTRHQEKANSNRITHKFPSWVADLTMKNYSGVQDRFSALLFAQRGIFAAGPPNCETPCQISEDSIVLRVKAVLIGKIGKVLQPSYSPGAQTWAPPSIVTQRWAKLYFRDGNNDSEGNGGDRAAAAAAAAWLASSYEPTGEPATQAFWRTVVMDCKAYPIRRLTKDEMSIEHVPFDKILMSVSSSSSDLEEKKEQERKQENEVAKTKDLFSNPMFDRTCSSWYFTISENGLYCMIRMGAQEGDILAVLDGGKVPVILRPVDQERVDDSRYTVVGTAYVHGYMDGEAAAACEQGILARRDVDLV